MPFGYTPPTGLSDVSAFPTVPANETAARQQVMDLFNQVRDYMNNSLANKIQEAWTTATLQNGWTNASPSYNAASYMKDQFGLVYIRGLINVGAITQGTVIFNLPVGYRPTFKNTYPVSSGSSLPSSIEVDFNGNVMVGVNGNNTFLSLSIAPFRAEA